MFSSLTKGFYSAFDTLFGASKITKYDILKMIKTIKKLLINSDVSLGVIKVIILRLEEKLLNAEIKKNTSSRELIIKALEEELIDILSIYNSDRKISHKGFILLCGLQGQGKTTSAAKLSKYLIKHDKKVLLTSLDFYRPAAIQQLEILAKDIDVDFLSLSNDGLAHNLVLIQKQMECYDVVIVDTAGRSHIDQVMMSELQTVYNALLPKEVLFVADAMQGQQGVEVAKGFNVHVPLTGVILTKLDSNSTAGAVLSIQYEVKIPIKLLGVGEKVDRFEEFQAIKIVNRILDKGDVQGIIDKVNEISQEEDAKKLMTNIESGRVTLNDYLYMINSIKGMGGMKTMLMMIPGAQAYQDLLNDDSLKRFDIDIYILSSMTKKEKDDINLFNESRKLRVAKGSGRSLQEVNKMLKSFKKMKGQIKNFKNMDMNNLSKMF